MTSTLIKPSDYIKALVCGFPSPLREKRLLIMLVGCVDDSGSHEHDGMYILAGFIATSENWANFSDEWLALCRQPPMIEDFKMRVASRLKGTSTYWGDGTEAELRQRRTEKLQALAALITKYACYRIHAGLDWYNYRAFAKNKVPSHIDSPYFFLYWNLIYQVVHEQQRIGMREKVDFIFDEQGGIGKTAKAWYTTIRPKLPPSHQYILSSSPNFRQDSDFLPLKAADMLAWLMLRHVERKDLAEEGMLQILTLLLDVPCIHASIDGSHLKDIVREVNYEGDVLPDDASLSSDDDSHTA